MKPSPFKLLDLCSFGLVAIIFTTLAIYCAVSGVTGQALVMMFAVAALGWGIYAALVLIRKSFIDEFPESVNKVQIKRAGYLAPLHDMETDLNDLTGKMRVDYGSKVDDALKDWIWVEFKPGVVYLGYDKKTKVAGYVTVGGSSAYVGYFKKLPNGEFVSDPTVPIRNTAFRHEIGEILLGRITGDWTESKHHAILAKYGC
jgi:hypothetical protein